MTNVSLPLSADAGAERLLRSAQSEIAPAKGAEARVRAMMRSRMRGPALLRDVRESLTPDTLLLPRLWKTILHSIDPLNDLPLWDRVQKALRPAADVREAIWSRLLGRLQPTYAPFAVSYSVKWVAAFALVLVAVRASPLLFLAPASIAESPVTLFPTRGDVEVLVGSLWQPMDGELQLSSATRFQTQEGEATVVIHDDAVLRLQPHTRVALLDLSDRPEVTKQETTLVLEQGELWILGLVPKHIRGITVVTAQGKIEVHEGSLSLRQDGDEVAVRVFDRSAVVSRHGKQVALHTGSSTTFTGANDLPVTRMSPSQFHETWVATNLGRDAAHQREIAQLQQERRAASAGFLPGTTLYDVKRLAEKVDVLLTFSSEERARKLITQANTRLNEAAALLQDSATAGEAETALQEYKDTLLQVASGSGGNSVVQLMIQQEVVDSAPATVSAALPGDNAYALKQAVDAAIVALPESIDKPDMEGEVLLDQLAAVKRQAEEGDTELAREKLSEIADSLASLETTGTLSLVSADIREEAKAVAIQVAAAVEGPAEGLGLSLGAPEKDFLSPQHPSRDMVYRPLTPAQVADKAQTIRGRVFVFGTKKAQYDALEDQLRLIVRHPSRGSILRELSKVMPRNGLAQRVLREIRIVSEEVQEQVTASGGTAPTAQ